MMKAIGLSLFLAASICSGQEPIPDVDLRIAFQQREGNSLNEDLHYSRLICLGGHCEMSTVTLNRCFEDGRGPRAFTPAIEHVRTADATMSVRREGNSLVTEERGTDIGGSYRTTLRFGLGKILPNSLSFDRLTSFSGRLVKNSQLVGRIITVEYVALANELNFVSLCAVRLPGLERSSKK